MQYRSAMSANAPRSSPLRPMLVGCALALAVGAGLLVVALVVFRGSALAFLRPPPRVEYPEPEVVEWADQPLAAASHVAPDTGSATKVATDVVPATATEPEPTGAALPVAIDLSKPVRISWPMDVGRDAGTDSRWCLRARQGANELLTVGRGDALYAVRVAEAARCRVWLRARYGSDDAGSTECNNSLLLVVNDRAPTLIGNDNISSQWAWRRGPAVELAEGVNWLRIELREDGPLLDHLALVPGDSKRRPDGLDDLEPVLFRGLAGEAEPFRPQQRIQEAEIFAVPTGSLAIGAGHANEIAVCASWQGRGAEGFEGSIAIHSTSAQGVTAQGPRQLACGPEAPFARNVVALDFPPDTARRAHEVTVAVADRTGKVVFRDAVRFVKPFAWAFLGPFPDDARRESARRIRTGSVVDDSRACERAPMLLARLGEPGSLGLGASPEWKIVADGSCCDWTGAVDLCKVYGPTENAFAYAVTWVQARSSTSRRLLSLQADDAAWLWVNGCLLVQMPMELPKEANRLWVSSPLRRGPNPVAIKLTQAKRYWGFHFGVVRWHWQGRKGSHDVLTGLEPDQWPGR